jgi:hypothetical protein
VAYDGTEDLTEQFYTKEQMDETIETHKHRLSEMENDIGFITSAEAAPTKLSQLYNDVGYVKTEEVYKKAETYTKDEIDSTLGDYYKKTDDLPDCHLHANKDILDGFSAVDGNLYYNGLAVGSGGSGGSGEGTSVDLTPYAKTATVNQQIENLGNSINTNLETNYATKTEVNAKANASDVYSKSDVDTTLGNYAKKSEIPDTTGFLTAVPAEYITETELNAKGYLVQNDISNLATKSEIPSLTGYLKYAVVSSVPSTQEEGVLYIVTE